MCLLFGDAQIVCLDSPPPSARGKLDIEPLHCITGHPPVAGSALILALEPCVRLVHAWSTSAAAAALYASQRKGCRVVLSLGGIETCKLPEWLMREANDAQILITVQTVAAKNKIVARGISGDMVQVIPPAADIVNVHNAGAKIRSALGLNDRHILLTAPGPITLRSGHKYVLWIFGILKRLLENLCVIVPGDGPAAPNARYFASTVGFDSEMFFTHGVLPPRQVLAGSNVAMFAHKSGCPAALVDALASGSPTVAWNTAETRELTSGGKLARLAPSGNLPASSKVILNLLEQTRPRLEMSAKAAKYARRQFEPEGVRAKFEKLYRAVLDVESRARAEMANE